MPSILTGNRSYRNYLDVLIAKHRHRVNEFDLDTLYFKSVNLEQEEENAPFILKMELGFDGDIHDTTSLKLELEFNDIEFIAKCSKEFVRRTKRGVKVATNIRDADDEITHED